MDKEALKKVIHGLFVYAESKTPSAFVKTMESMAEMTLDTLIDQYLASPAAADLGVK
jgi:hypothetical protein